MIILKGPCVGNQMTLANSRLWDAINGFFFLFAHMMEKLYKNSTQLELLREFLNLQKDMVRGPKGFGHIIIIDSRKMVSVYISCTFC